MLGTTFLSVDDAQATFDALAGRGVTVTQPVTEQSYGRDFQIADPFGNQIRIAQMAPV